MNWRRLIYSIIIPGLASIIFGMIISISSVTNLSIFLYSIVMLVAAILSSTGKGKNGDAASTLFFGLLIVLTVFLLVSIIGDIRRAFSIFFIVKMVCFMAATASSIYLAKEIMKKKPQNSEQN